MFAQIRICKWIGSHKWLIPIATFWARIIFDGISYSYGVILPLLLEEFGEELTVSTLPGTLNSALYYLLALLWIWLVDRYGIRATGLAGASIATAGLFLSSIAPNIAILILTHGLVSGSGMGMVILASDFALIRNFDDKIGYVFGLTATGSAFGQIIFPIIQETIRENLSWRWLFRIEGFISITVVFAMLVLGESKNQKNSKSVADIDSFETDGTEIINKISDELEKEKRFLKIGRPAFTNSTSLILAIASFFSGLGLITPIFFIVTDAEEAGFGLVKSALLISYLGIANLFGRFATGIIFQKANSFLCTLYIIAMHVISGVLQALFGYYNVRYAAYVTLALHTGFVFGSVTVSKYLHIKHLIPEIREMSLGVTYMLYGVSIILSGIIGGELEEATGSFTLTYLLGGINLVVASSFFISQIFVLIQKHKLVNGNKLKY